MGALYTCPSCARHVYEAEVRCPFCDRALDPTRVPRRRLPRETMSRAAQLAFTVMLGAQASGCASSSESKRPPRVEPPQNGVPPAFASPSATSIPSAAAPASAPPSATSSPSAAAPQTPPADAGAPAAQHQRVVAVYGSPVILIERICFRPHSAAIPKDATSTINVLVEVMKIHKVHVEVIGDAAEDEHGEAKSLSERRAKAVLRALVGAGAERERLTSFGQGTYPRPWESPPPSSCVRFHLASDDED